MNLHNVQMEKWISQTVRAQKVDEKMESFVLFPFLLPQL